MRTSWSVSRRQGSADRSSSYAQRQPRREYRRRPGDCCQMWPSPAGLSSRTLLPERRLGESSNPKRGLRNFGRRGNSAQRADKTTSSADLMRYGNCDLQSSEITLPALFRVDASENGNASQQVAIPLWHGKAVVQEFKQNRKRGCSTYPELRRCSACENSRRHLYSTRNRAGAVTNEMLVQQGEAL